MVLFPGEFPNFIKREFELLNSESMDSKFGQSDVYGNSIAKLNRNRDPGSMARDKKNATNGKGTRRKGQMEANWDEGIDNPGNSDKHHSQVEFEIEGEDDYQVNWADRTCAVRHAGESIDSPSYLDWREIENYGADSEMEAYLINHDGTCDYGDIIDPAGPG